MSEDKVKSEPKVLPQRLMSFRGSRDLSLGSVTAGKSCIGFPNNREKPRKLFTPNVNVQRKKNQEVVVKNEHRKVHENKNVRGSGRGRGQRGRNSSTLIQTSRSVFADGIAVSTTKNNYRRAAYDTDNVKDEILQKPKLNLNSKIDKAEEDRKLNELLRDDFLDANDLAPDSAFAPVSLPLTNYNKKTQGDTKLKICLEPKIKEEKEMYIDGVKIKQEKTEPENDTENSMKLEVDQSHIKKEPKRSENYDSMFLNTSLNSSEKQLILIQFPDRLPALAVESPGEAEQSSSKMKPKPGTSGTSGTSGTPGTSDQENVSEGNKYCRLSDLAPGHIGHLQIRKSGKIELVMGKCVLNVSPGTHVGFQQDLVAVQLHSGDWCSGETVDLGPVVPRLICTPDWNTLLKSGGSM